MLERINDVDYRFRIEDENTLLALNIINFEMLFLKGKTKEYITDLLDGKVPEIISQKNIDILKKKKIILEN